MVVVKFQVVRTVNNFLLAEFPVRVLGEEIAHNSAFALAEELGDCSVVIVQENE